MPQYDIRIQPLDGKTRTVRTTLPGDPHAIRQARQIADELDDLEVWRGMDCVYRRETLPHCRRLAS
jgi:hypothetical protein